MKAFQICVLILTLVTVTARATSVDISVLPEGIERLDIYLLLGQSNMKGRGEIPEKQNENPLIVNMNMENNQWYVAIHPLHKAGVPDLIDGSDNAGVGPGLDFAQALLAQDSTVMIALVPCAIGGSNINLWQPGRDFFENAIIRAQKALSDGPSGKTRIRGVLWLQGESDAGDNTRYQSYESKLSSVIQGLRANLNEPELPFIACTIGTFIDPAKYPHVREINNILLTLPEREVFTACVDARDVAGHIGDRMHYNTDSQKELGKRYASLSMSLLAEPVKLAAIFSSGAVLQRDQIGAVWGSALPNETLRLIIMNQSISVEADNTGSWRIDLDPQPAGGPYTLSVSGSQSASTVLTNIYFGDVWLLTGQSNMNQSVAGQIKSFPEYYPEIPNSDDDFDYMRFALIKEIQNTFGPANDVVMQQKWSRWEKNKLDDMSAVGYFFARSLKASLDANEMGHIPLGFIKVCRGATSAEQWISAVAIETMDEPLIPRSDKPASSYYNGMIAPIQDYAVKGVLWYQGEANTDNISRIEQYPLVFETLVNSWRDEWDNFNLPFYYVQLAPFRKYSNVPTEGRWALMRKSQTDCLSISNTAMACIIDGGLQGNIHPPFKDWVGNRLARIALDRTYGISTVFRGPTIRNCQIKGSDVIVTFDNVADGIETRSVDAQPDEEEIAAGFPAVSANANELAGFSLSGSDGIYYWATEAEIIGPDKVRISNTAAVPDPESVQYAWQNFPRCNLYNSEGLPAEPFQTGSCEVVTHTLSEVMNKGVFIYTYSNKIFISNTIEQPINVEFYDLAAKQIGSIKNIGSSYELEANMKGVFIAKIYSETEVISVEKLIIL